jgi:ribosomal protein S18 acetylase RimI-like enzyme
LIIYREDLRGVTPERLTGFWSSWPSPPPPELHQRILEGSEAILLAVDTDDDDRVVGFITAIGDGLFASCIPLLEVLPAYRGRGIGTELVRRMLARLGDRYMVDLVCDEEVMPFYEQAGMTRYGAMIQRRPSAIERLR